MSEVPFSHFQNPAGCICPVFCTSEYCTFKDCEYCSSAKTAIKMEKINDIILQSLHDFSDEYGMLEAIFQYVEFIKPGFKMTLAHKRDFGLFLIEKSSEIDQTHLGGN